MAYTISNALQTAMQNALQNTLQTTKSTQESVQKPDQTLRSGEEQGKSPAKSFGAFLQESLTEVNALQHGADKMAAEVATGKTENIHETMLALSQAELSFKMMVQVRNKALEAYQEVMRMPV